MKFAFLSLIISMLSLTLYAKDFSVKVNDLKSGEIDVQFKVQDFSLSTREIDGNTYTVINFDGGVTTKKKGYAEIPYLSATVQIDNRFDVNPEINLSRYDEYELNYPLLPSKGVIYRNQNPAQIPYEINKDSVTDTWYPISEVQISNPFIMRDLRGVNVYGYPFHYNAKRQTLRVYRTIKVLLKQNQGTSTNVLTVTNNSINPTMDGIYKTIFKNYSQTERVHLGEIGDILVITVPELKEAILPYVEWKKQKGHQVQVKEVSIGTNVKNIIKTSFTANPNILYVQLVGDWNEIKSDLGPDMAPMDPMLGLVVGNDYYADLIVGRFSGSTKRDISIQVQKVLDYELNPEMGASWYKRAIGIASNEGGNGKGDDGESDETHMGIIRQNRLLEYNYSDVFEGYQNNSVTNSDIKRELERGVGLINYVGHGSETSWSTSSFSNSDIDSLTNGKKLPFIVSVACVNGKFHRSGGDSFAERWLKKENGGAVAALMATINQPWEPPMRGQDYFNDLLIGGYNYDESPGNGTNIEEKRTTFGSLAYNALYLMFVESNESSDLDTIKTWTLFGDASLQVRTNEPKKVSITNSSVKFGVPFITKITDGKNPIEGAIVSVYQDNKSYSSATDLNGSVSIVHDLKVKNAIITITGQNFKPIHQQVMVEAPNEAFIAFKDFTIDGSSGELGVGERKKLSILVRNYGTQTARNLKFVLSTTSSKVRIIDANESQSVILGNKEVWLDKGFEVETEIGLLDGEKIPFVLIASDSSQDYRSEFSVEVVAPKFDIDYELIGPPNFGAGDSISVSYEVKNIGHMSAKDLIFGFQSLNSLPVQVVKPEIKIGEIRVGETKKITFNLNLGNSIPTGSRGAFRLKLISPAIPFDFVDFQTIIGVFESFESANFQGNEWYFTGDANWVIEEIPLNGSRYAARPGKITGNQSSSLKVRATSSKHGLIRFKYKVSTEKNYDWFEFYVDGMRQGRWSGEVAWTEFSYAIAEGEHQLEWKYIKDSSVNGGEDTAFIDDIIIE